MVSSVSAPLQRPASKGSSDLRLWGVARSVLAVEPAMDLASANLRYPNQV
ncbi:hypothetical protein M3J09_006666 [Ascochyta lentis]